MPSVNCCVPMCKSSKIKNPDIRFHTFPKCSDKIKFGGEIVNRRNVWMDKLGISKVTTRMTVCSLHFIENDYFKGCGKIRQLKKNAIPSVNITPPAVIQSLNSGINDILIPGSVPSHIMLSNLEERSDPLNCTAENRKLKLEEESSNIKVEALTSSADEYTSDYDFLLDNVDIKLEPTELEEPTPKKQKLLVDVTQIDMEHGFDTPERAKINFNLAVNQVNTLKKKIICLKTKVKYLEKYINHLKDNNLIPKEAHSSIQVIVSSIVQQLHNTNEYIE